MSTPFGPIPVEPDWDAAGWRTSSRTAGSGQCVEVARVPGLVAVRDSKAPGQGRLLLPADSWTRFLIRCRN